MTDASDDPPCACKVGQLVETYDLVGMHETLRRRWTDGGPDGERSSVRELTRHLNESVLGQVLADAEMSTFEGEAENAYRLLTDEDVSDGTTTEVENALRRNDVDPDALRSAFVSHQTVYRHLRTCLSAEPDSSPPTTEDELERLYRLENRTIAVARDAIERQSDRGDLAVEGFDVLVTTRVLCENCGMPTEVTELLSQGGCSCLADESA